MVPILLAKVNIQKIIKVKRLSELEGKPLNEKRLILFDHGYYIRNYFNILYYLLIAPFKLKVSNNDQGLNGTIPNYDGTSSKVYVKEFLPQNVCTYIYAI